MALWEKSTLQSFGPKKGANFCRTTLNKLNQLSNGYRLCGSRGPSKKDTKVTLRSDPTWVLSFAWIRQVREFKVQTLASIGTPLFHSLHFFDHLQSLSCINTQEKEVQLQHWSCPNVSVSVNINPVSGKEITTRCSIRETSLLHMLV